MFEWLKKRVSLKVAALSTGLIVLVLAGNGAIWYVTSWAVARKVDVARAIETGGNLEALISAKLVEHSSPKGHQYNFLTEIHARNRSTLGLDVYDRGGRLKIRVGKPPVDAPIQIRRTLRFRAACTGCHDSRVSPIGALTFGFRAPEQQQLHQWSMTFLVWSGALALLAFIVVGWSVHRFLARPLEELSKTVEAAEEGFFLTRAKVDRRDEIGRLGQHFNTLLEKITDLKVNIIDTDRELEWAQQELALKRELESKNEIIESTNQELERTLQELRVLFEITQTLNSTIELDQVLAKMSTQITQALDIKEFAVFLQDETSNRLQLKATYGFFEDESDKQPKYRVLRELSQRVVELGESLRVDDTTRDPRFEQTRYGGEIPGTLLCLPVVFMQRCIGTLCFFRPRPKAFDQEEVTLLRSIANQAAMAIGNAQMYHRTKELSIHDELTAIYNRRFLRNRLEMEWSRSKRFDHPLSVLLM
ncbi:MAG: GAF domain-containing protein, partial [Myxococcales bacterium]|nr:GAF domain-containing protein [Myxococcales bacterium]